MNDFEKQIHRAFDRMFHDIEVPPADSVAGRIQRDRQRRRAKRYMITGISVAAAAGLMAMVSMPHLFDTATNSSVAFKAPPGSAPAPGEPGSTKPGVGQATPAPGGQSPDTGGVSQHSVGPGTDGSSEGQQRGDGSKGSGVLATGGTSGTSSPHRQDASGSSAPKDQSPTQKDTPSPTEPGTPHGGASNPGSGQSSTGDNNPAGGTIARAIVWTPYLPSFIPAGYVPMVEFSSATVAPAGSKPPAGVRWTYQGPDDAILVIVQTPLGPSGSVSLPVSPYPQEQTTVHGQAAVFQQGSDNLLHLIWVENNIRFDIATNTDKQTLLQVATGLAPLGQPQ